MSNTDRQPLGSRLLFELDLEVAPTVSIGATPSGEIRLVPITGGTFEGSELRGRILPGGADWQEARSDGTLEIRARYLLETDTGERIEVRSEGLRAAPPEVLALLARGEIVPANQYYFRTHVRLRTSVTRLAHLNDLLAVSMGQRMPKGVRLSVFAIL
jgi:uncharacterized protein DUF3237